MIGGVGTKAVTKPFPRKRNTGTRKLGKNPQAQAIRCPVVALGSDKGFKHQLAILHAFLKPYAEPISSVNTHPETDHFFPLLGYHTCLSHHHLLAWQTRTALTRALRHSLLTLCHQGGIQGLTLPVRQEQYFWKAHTTCNLPGNISTHSTVWPLRPSARAQFLLMLEYCGDQRLPSHNGHVQILTLLLITR